MFGACHDPELPAIASNPTQTDRQVTPMTDELSSDPDWSELWGFAGQDAERCDIAFERAVEYTASTYPELCERARDATTFNDPAYNERDQRCTYFEIAYLLHGAGIGPEQTFQVIQSADRRTWAADDFVLDHADRADIMAGWMAWGTP